MLLRRRASGASSTAHWRLQMSDLVVIAFPSEAKAEEIRHKLLDMQNDYLVELADAVIAVKQPNGSVKLNQLFHPTAAGALSGLLGYADRLDFYDAASRRSNRRGFGCPWRGVDRCRHQRSVYEGCCPSPAV